MLCAGKGRGMTPSLDSDARNIAVGLERLPPRQGELHPRPSPCQSPARPRTHTCLLASQASSQCERYLQTKLSATRMARALLVVRPHTPDDHIPSHSSFQNRLRVTHPPIPARALPESRLTFFYTRVGRPTTALCSWKGRACMARRPHFHFPRPVPSTPGPSGPGTVAKLRFGPVGRPRWAVISLPCGPRTDRHFVRRVVACGPFSLRPCIVGRDCTVDPSSGVHCGGAGGAGPVECGLVISDARPPRWCSFGISPAPRVTSVS